MFWFEGWGRETEKSIWICCAGLGVGFVPGCGVDGEPGVIAILSFDKIN